MCLTVSQPVQGSLPPKCHIPKPGNALAKPTLHTKKVSPDGRPRWRADQDSTQSTVSLNKLSTSQLPGNPKRFDHGFELEGIEWDQVQITLSIHGCPTLPRSSHRAWSYVDGVLSCHACRTKSTYALISKSVSTCSALLRNQCAG